jgi:hypothetical protein
VITSIEHLLNIDFGVAQAGGYVLPTANIKARTQFATVISDRF